MKKIIFILTILIILVLPFQCDKQSSSFDNQIIYLNLPYFKEDKNLTLKPVLKELNLKNREKSILYINPNNDKKTQFFQFKDCSKSVATPDKLDKMLSSKQGGDSTSRSFMNSLDCGVIESVFPLSF